MSLIEASAMGIFEKVRCSRASSAVATTKKLSAVFGKRILLTCSTRADWFIRRIAALIVTAIESTKMTAWLAIPLH